MTRPTTGASYRPQTGAAGGPTLSCNQEVEASASAQQHLRPRLTSTAPYVQPAADSCSPTTRSRRRRLRATQALDRADMWLVGRALLLWVRAPYMIRAHMLVLAIQALLTSLPSLDPLQAQAQALYSLLRQARHKARKATWPCTRPSRVRPTMAPGERLI